MTHDPLCDLLYQRQWPTPAEGCLACHIITQVRTDERRHLGDAVWAAHHCEDRNGCPVCTTVMRAIAIREHPSFTV